MILHHYSASAFCRKIRLALAEKGLAFSLRAQKPWEADQDFLALNPAGDVPVLEIDGGGAVCGHQVIAEYLDDAGHRPGLIGGDPERKAEIRRLCMWFDDKFMREVGRSVVGERVMRRLKSLGPPDARTIKAGRLHLKIHLTYMSWLLERRHWLAGGDDVSLADFAAGAHLSVLDYLDEVDWDAYPDVKSWYYRIKSRPSFSGLLKDKLPGFVPSAHYADLDF